MEPRKKFLKILIFSLLLAGWGKTPEGLSQAWGGTLAFSKPERLVTLPWSDGSNHGVPSSGPEWLVVDEQGKIYLETNLDFDSYDSSGKYLQRINPIDKSKNFYGFIAMESLSDGSLALLARLETPQEQWGKDNFEEHSKPGARLIVLAPGGQVKQDKEEVDPLQPHSSYYLEEGSVYGVHDDGTYQNLDFLGIGKPKDRGFAGFAAVTNKENWWNHAQGLPVFQSGNRIYHDTKGRAHEIKGATASLMGQALVEGTGPLAIRNGVIYYQVVCDKNQDFINAIFVEDPVHKNYGLVDLFRSEEDLDMANGHAIFIDSKGDIFEGVGKKDGYRIYEWKRGS